MQETWVRLVGGEDALEKEVAARSSLLAGKSHGQEPGSLFHGLSESDVTQQLDSNKVTVKLGLQKALNAFFNNNYLKKKYRCFILNFKNKTNKIKYN